jgi:hypothetical protein
MLSTRELVGKKLFSRDDAGNIVGTVMAVLLCLVIVGALCIIASRRSADPWDNSELIRRRQRERDYEAALRTLDEGNRKNDDGVDLREAHTSHNLQTPPSIYGKSSDG